MNLDLICKGNGSEGVFGNVWKMLDAFLGGTESTVVVQFYKRLKMKREFAEKICQTLFDQGEELTAILQQAKKECSKEEVEWMKSGIAMVMGYSYTEILARIYLQYPELDDTK